MDIIIALGKYLLIVPNMGLPDEECSYLGRLAKKTITGELVLSRNGQQTKRQEFKQHKQR